MSVLATRHRSVSLYVGPLLDKLLTPLLDKLSSLFSCVGLRDFGLQNDKDASMYSL